MNNKQAPVIFIKMPGHFFFSNYFYGLCAVALSIEAMLQQQVPLNGSIYFFLVFITTILYYAYPYIKRGSLTSSNPRTRWYTRHYTLMRWNQIVITSLLGAAVIVFFFRYSLEIWTLKPQQWLLILLFPIVAAFYYGSNTLLPHYNLRKIGWLKPFVIGFTWAGLVTIYPVLFYDIVHQEQHVITEVTVLLFFKNLMFVAVLCIMFDIKDYATDFIHRLKTFVVKLGLRKTIFYVVLPLSAVGLGGFIIYAFVHDFHPMKLLLNAIPFILLAVVAFSLKKRRPLLYYLIIVDGLMLVKAVFGSIAMIYF